MLWSHSQQGLPADEDDSGAVDGLENGQIETCEGFFKLNIYGIGRSAIANQSKDKYS